MLSQKHIQARLSQKTIDRLLLFAEETLAWCQDGHNPDDYKEKFDELKSYTNLELQSLNYLPFRKMRFSRKVYFDQQDKRLIKILKSKFGEDSVLILGDWSAPTVKYHEPIRNKGMIRMLKKNGFDVYLINEFKTSSVCPDCEGALKKFCTVANPRPYRREKNPTVTCNGLLKCDNHSPAKLWNRDLAAVCNFRKILNKLRKTGNRPICLSR